VPRLSPQMITSKDPYMADPSGVGQPPCRNRALRCSLLRAGLHQRGSQPSPRCGSVLEMASSQART